MNRLNLDFTLSTSRERQDFVTKYLQNIDFNPTNKELETIANYVLYGRNETDDEYAPAGKSLVDSGHVIIEVRNSPWTKKRPESLDALLETSAETGNPVEMQYGLVHKRPPSYYRIRKETFSRKATRKALETRDPRLLREYEDLWRRIDETEYLVTRYALIHNRRKLPIRDELLSRLVPTVQRKLDLQAQELSAYHWSKLRHHLVFLREEQYILRDGYSPTIGRPRRFTSVPGTPSIEEVLPLGTKSLSNYGDILFPDNLVTLIESNSRDYISDFITNFETPSGNVLDFENPEHVAALIYLYKDLEHSPEEDDLETQEFIVSLGNTLLYYIVTSKLDPMHIDIVRMKSEGEINDVIKDYVNTKYDKTYSSNYISTIFRRKCCEAIAEAATKHVSILRSYVNKGRGGFKKCNTCGTWLLRDASEFVRKARSRDGLSSRCKSCDRDARNRPKE